MLLMIDNYDSFTYNLVQYFEELGEKVRTFRNDELSAADVRRLRRVDRLVISPGPGTPAESGVSKDAIRHFLGKVPILGVCLGHQMIGEMFGCRVVRARLPVHGKNSQIFHDSSGIFAGIENPFDATRYHSLVVSPRRFSGALRITARTEDGIIMGIRHARYPIEGIQFHPEAILTSQGKNLLRNFLGQTCAKARSGERCAC